MASTFGWGGVGIGANDAESDDTPPARVPVVVDDDEAPSHANAKGGFEDDEPAWAKGVVAQDAQPAESSSMMTQTSAAASRAQSKDQIAPTPEAQTPADVRKLQMRVNELERREKALAERERRVMDVEKRLEDGGVEIKRKNWPRCKPLLYHDIDAEVPTPNQACCKAGYLCWMMAQVAFLFNFIAVSIMMFAGTATIACWFFSALATVIGIFCSFWCWYTCLYKCLQTHGSTWAYGKFFIHMGIFFVWCVWAFIAPPVSSTKCQNAGFFVMLDQFSTEGSKGTMGGILCIIAMVIWGLTGLLGFYVLIWSFTIWKKGGGLEDLEDQRKNVGTAASIFSSSVANTTAQRLFGGKPPA